MPKILNLERYFSLRLRGISQREIIRFIREKYKLGILVIEHDMKFIMGLCERIYVLDHGQLIAQGTPEEVRSNKEVIKAYLGEEDTTTFVKQRAR